ncbi:MAG: hypothetical protein P1U67_13820 [Alcanivoracaceae bacterium]|nr:hypothetical protein [Alcanivoracaceae bacterium]
MKRIHILTACLFLIAPAVHAGSALKGKPVINEAVYDAQLAEGITQARSLFTRTGTVQVLEDELEIAPLVIKVDFQRYMKAAQGVTILAEYKPWFSEGSFQDIATNADNLISEKLAEMLNEVYALGDAPQEVAENPKKPYKVSFPALQSNLNSKVPSDAFTVVAYEKGGFKNKNALKATQLSAGDAQAVVFFPYVNLVFHKQDAGLSQMNGELVLNYTVDMNGYFDICIPDVCYASQLPYKKHIRMTVPLVTVKAETSDETHQEVYAYGEQFITQMVTDFTLEGFKKAAGRD